MNEQYQQHYQEYEYNTDENNLKKKFEQITKIIYLQLNIYNNICKDVCNIIIDYYQDKNDIFISSIDQNPKDIDIWIQNTEQEIKILNELKNLGFQINDRYQSENY